MRVYDDTCLDHMASPARHIFPYISRALNAVVPERKDESGKMFPDFRLEYHDTHKWLARAIPPRRTIRLSRKAVEMAWVMTYGAIKLEPIRANGLVNGCYDLDLATIPEAKPACRLINWAFTTWLNCDDLPWPEELPQPQEGDLRDPAMTGVLQGSLGVLGFLLLHELGHIHYNHDPDSSGAEEEREADYWAVDFLFDRCPEDGPTRFRRGTICAIALGLIVAKDAHTSTVHCGRHPPSYDRLVHSLQRHFPDEADKVWMFASGVLALHLSNSPLQNARRGDMTEYRTPLEIVQREADFLSQLPWSTTSRQ